MQVSISSPYNLGWESDNSESSPQPLPRNSPGQPSVNDEIREELVRPTRFRESGTMVALSLVYQRKRNPIR